MTFDTVFFWQVKRCALVPMQEATDESVWGFIMFTPCVVNNMTTLYYTPRKHLENYAEQNLHYSIFVR